MSYIVAAFLTGAFSGTVIGFALCALLVIAKESDKHVELLQQADEELYPDLRKFDKRA